MLYKLRSVTVEMLGRCRQITLDQGLLVPQE
jgi:hypothetical protein